MDVLWPKMVKYVIYYGAFTRYYILSWKDMFHSEIPRDFWYVMQEYIGNKMTLLLQFVVGSTLILHKYPRLNGEVYVFTSVGWFVCLSVSNITGKRMNRFSWNFQDRSSNIQGTIWKMLGVLCLTPSIQARSYIHYRQQILNIFHFNDFLFICGVCRVYLYLVYIATSRYYFWGNNSKSIAKWTAKVQKQLFWSFLFIRHWLESLLHHCQIAAIFVRVFIRDIMHNITVYLQPRLVRSAGD